MRVPWDLVRIATLLLIGLVVRLGALPFEGHSGDVAVMARWAERMAEVGPWRFYEGDGSIYPALLYPLWALATDLDGPALDLAIKGLSIPFDLVIGVVLYVVVRDRGTELAGLAAAALYLLNPAVILAGPVWGQVDSAGTLAFLGALLASGHRRDGVAGALAVVAMFCKPQFGLVLLPVLAVAAIRTRPARDLAIVGRAFGGMALAYVVIGLPLALHPMRYLDLLSNTAQQQPAVSLHAFNPWGMLIGFGVPDDGYVLIGTIALLVGIVGVMSGLRRGDNLTTILAVGAMLTIAFYFLPTRVHERYLFPAMALLVPFAVATAGQAIAYLLMAVGFAASLLYTLHDITSFELPVGLASVLVTPSGVWAIGLTLIVSAVAWTWLLLVRVPRLPGEVSPEP
jgi:Gpi18-like mannosyltransferase